MLPIFLKAKTWFLKQKVKIAILLGSLVILTALLVGSYQLGKKDAQAHCEQTRLETELQEETQKSEFLLGLQEENAKFYRDQLAFNSSLAGKLENENKEIVYKVDTIYRETPVEVYNPCGNASIDFEFVRVRNDAGSAQANPD